MKGGAIACLALSLATVGMSARADDFRATPPASHAMPRLAAPAIREGKLGNGVRLLVVERTGGLPIASLRVVSDVGAFAAEPGVAYLAARSALRGESDLAHALDEITAFAGARAEWDGVDMRVSCLAPELDHAIELAWGAATKASFHRVYVNDARADERHDREETRWDARRALDAALYPSGDPMHDGMWGPGSATESVTAEQLGAYFARAFAPEHVTLIVVGDTTLEAVTASATKWMWSAHLQNAPAPLAPAQPPSPKRGLTVVDRPGSTQSSVALGAMGVPRGSPDAAAIEVLTAALSRRLDAILRQRYGFTYGFDATAFEWRTRGSILIEGKVEASRTAQSVRELLAVVDRLREDPLDDTELTVAKTLRRHLDPRNEEATSNAASALARLVEEGLPLDTWPREIAAIDRVTKEDVLRVARAYLDPAHMPIVVVGDAKSIAPSLPDVGTP